MAQPPASLRQLAHRTNYSCKLIEQPMLGCCSAGPLPVSAIRQLLGEALHLLRRVVRIRNCRWSWPSDHAHPGFCRSQVAQPKKSYSLGPLSPPAYLMPAKD